MNLLGTEHSLFQLNYFAFCFLFYFSSLAIKVFWARCQWTTLRTRMCTRYSFLSSDSKVAPEVAVAEVNLTKPLPTVPNPSLETGAEDSTGRPGEWR